MVPVAVVLAVLTVAVVLAVVAEAEPEEKADGRMDGRRPGETLEPKLSEVGGKNEKQMKTRYQVTQRDPN